MILLSLGSKYDKGENTEGQSEIEEASILAATTKSCVSRSEKGVGE